MLHNRVLTKSLLIKKGLGMENSCSIRASAEEMPIHLFRDCSTVKNIWLALIPPQVHNSFFSLLFDQWVSLNCQFMDYSWEGMSWSALFFVFYWCLWKKRNDKLFNGKNLTLNVQFIRKQVHFIARAYHKLVPGKPLRREVLICWEFPPTNWIKLNSNWASKGEARLASCGGVLRNHMGKWLRGYTANLGAASVVEDEIWGLYYGLYIACMDWRL